MAKNDETQKMRGKAAYSETVEKDGITSATDTKEPATETEMEAETKKQAKEDQSTKKSKQKADKQDAQKDDGADTEESKNKEDLMQEIEELRNKSNEYFDGWQRERADFTNYRKRIERDQVLARQNTTGEIAKKYLVILDDIERALKNRPQEGEGAAWAEGIELIYRKLQSILEAEGITPIPAENEEFNPSFHEAISQEESPDHESNYIIEVLQQGYTLGDRVLRPALVRVAR